MSKPPVTPTPSGKPSTGQKIEHAIEKALDPFASALKRATAPGSAAAPAPTAPGKPGLKISPLAVPFPTIPPIAGVEIATGRAGFYKHERDDWWCSVSPRHHLRRGLHPHGSARRPVDWCKRHLDSARAARMCAPWWSTPVAPTASPARPGADAAPSYGHGRRQALRLPPARRDAGLDRGHRRGSGRPQDRRPLPRSKAGWTPTPGPWPRAAS
jgi:glutamate N-acetyltransferase/amino-acid N-acetyltransferase